MHEPKGHRTHPMSEKIRGALFNILGDTGGLTVLDAFAGSGALAIEAVSRGAKNAVAIERDRLAQAALVQNVQELGLASQIKAIKASAGGWSDNNPNKKFDIVLLDPPFDDLQPNLLHKIAKRHAKTGGVVVLSKKPSAEFQLMPTNYELLAVKTYGDAQLVFYKPV